MDKRDRKLVLFKKQIIFLFLLLILVWIYYQLG